VPTTRSHATVFTMHFGMVDRVLERSEDRIVTLKNVTNAEEYLRDHFPTFPVLPGVLMIEALVQAARLLLEDRLGPPARRLMLGEVRALKYGAFVKPGESLRVEVTVQRVEDDGSVTCKGVAQRVGVELDDGGTAVSGRFTLRDLRLAQANPAAG
jgi:3-hydroxyacyl-[acyl-carrier-protein] dehydratase